MCLCFRPASANLAHIESLSVKSFHDLFISLATNLRLLTPIKVGINSTLGIVSFFFGTFLDFETKRFTFTLPSRTTRRYIAAAYALCDESQKHNS